MEKAGYAGRKRKKRDFCNKKPHSAGVAQRVGILHLPIKLSLIQKVACMKIQFGTILSLFHGSMLFAQVSLKDIASEHGNYRVGFRHYLTVDSTRTYKRIYDWNNQQIFRPVSVSVWYPSTQKPKNVSSMRVLDYMEILKEEEEWEHLPNDQILNWFYYPNTPGNRKHLAEQTTAFRGIRPATGKFAVLIYAPSYQASAIENFSLCEYLASHGYLVLSSPSRGTENRSMEGGSVKDMETQARDIEFLIKEASTNANANPDQIATIGFSFGGLSNVLAQMRNARIKAIVSLDGSIKYQYPTLKKSAFADLKRVNVPFIHMAQKDIPEKVLREDKIDGALNSKFEFYDSLKYSKAYSFKFHNLTHSNFSTLGVLFQPRDARQDKPDSDIATSYKLVSKYTLAFLDAYLANDAKALSFLEHDPGGKGINEAYISKKEKDPEALPFSFHDFNELALKEGYANLEKLYDSLRMKHAALGLEEGNLNNLGLQLLFNRKTSAQGINILLLAVTIYPKSANLFDSLAEGYLYTGNKEKAILNFEKSLQLDATNQNALNRLQELRNRASR